LPACRGPAESTQCPRPGAAWIMVRGYRCGWHGRMPPLRFCSFRCQMLHQHAGFALKWLTLPPPPPTLPAPPHRQLPGLSRVEPGAPDAAGWLPGSFSRSGRWHRSLPSGNPRTPALMPTPDLLRFSRTPGSTLAHGHFVTRCGFPLKIWPDFPLSASSVVCHILRRT
jgi:hypothetical protein